MFKQLLLVLLCSISVIAGFTQNVGIGTSTPTTRLHVVDSLSFIAKMLLQAPTAATNETVLEITTGSNIFNNLQISKFAPGATGTSFGIPKDNLSSIITGGDAGSLLLGTGNNTSPILFAAGTGEQMRITANGHVGIGTASPANTNNLHVHSNDPANANDVSIGITNSATSDAPMRGARFRMLGSDLKLINYENTGKLHLTTNFNDRLTIDAAGNIGINKTNPAYLLDIASTGNSSRAINIEVNNALTSTTGMRVRNPNNDGVSSFSLGIHAIAGSGASFMLSPNVTYGIIGESLNTTRGYGVLGVSHSPSTSMREAGVVGVNYSTGASAYGVIGESSGSSGAGVVGYTSNLTVGLLGVADPFSIGPAIKAVAMSGSIGPALELENGALKVSGTKRTAFQHTATAGNITSQETIIPNTTLANSSTDMLFVTPVWEGVYVNAPIGVYFLTGNWRIFRQDLQPMPLNAKFNVLVVKQ